MEAGFRSTMRKGFHMTFANGLTASVQWGAGNYCDNHLPEDMDFSFTKDAKSSTAEVAVFNDKGDIIDANPFVPEEQRSCDTVVGWLTTEQVAQFLSTVATYNTSNTKEG